MYQRRLSKILAARLTEPRAFMQVVVGPRQTGKTTAIRQALEQAGLPAHVAAADSSVRLDESWIELEWAQARRLAADDRAAVLVLDEIQKVRNWSSVVKRLWDEDAWSKTNLIVVLSGSSSLLIQSGRNESLAGRFEILRSTHWSFAEMREAFGYTFDDYLKFGGYPGTYLLKSDEERALQYMHDSIIETTISRDILQMENVKKPALLRALFELGAQYSAQELSYRKILGQLDDKGNTDVIKHYLELLSGAGMMSGLQKYEAKDLNSRASSPRLMVHDPALMYAESRNRMQLLEDLSMRGHLVETAVGATLIAQSITDRSKVYWWRDGSDEVDFVVVKGDALYAIEVKSGRVKKSGLAEFCKRYPQAVPLVLGSRNAPIEDFLLGKIALD